MTNSYKLAERINSQVNASVTFAKAEQHRAAVNLSDDPLNYDYTTGWPIIYGE